MDKYRVLLSEINRNVRNLGFRRKGATFFNCEEGNVGLLNFQKSTKSNSHTTFFTLNLGVYCSTLNQLDVPGMGAKPTISDCHWRERIGFLLPERHDYWWQINDADPLENLISEVIGIVLSIAVPEIKKHITDISLQDSWMEGIFSGINEQQMYIYLIAMLKSRNHGSLMQKVQELKAISKGRPFEQNVLESLIDLGIQL